MCRHCSPKWGDVIGYVMRRDRIEFQEALRILAPNGIFQQERKTQQPHEVDRAKWADAALQFLEQCQPQLWGDDGEGARAYLHWRGLTDDTLRLWGIGYNPLEGYGISEQWGLPHNSKIKIPKGIVTPCQDAAGMHYIKIRQQKGDPKYFILKGGQGWIYGAQTYRDATTAFLFEGEFDVMLAYQTGFTGVGYASLPASQNITTTYQPFFETIIDIIVAYDNDIPGQEAADKLCRMPHFLKAEPFPYGKDLTEFAQMGGDVFEWLYRQVEQLGGVNES
jgi:DNA primase